MGGTGGGKSEVAKFGRGKRRRLSEGGMVVVVGGGAALWWALGLQPASDTI